MEMSVEEAVADLQRRKSTLQHEIKRDIRSAMDEIAQNNQKLLSNLEKFYQAKEQANIEPLQQRLGQLQDTKKTIRDITQKLRNISSITTQISASSSPSPDFFQRVRTLSVRNNEDAVRNNEDDAVEMTTSQSAAHDHAPPLLPAQQPAQGMLRGVGTGIAAAAAAADSSPDNDSAKSTAWDYCTLSKTGERHGRFRGPDKHK